MFINKISKNTKIIINSLQSYTENIKNFNVINSYNRILNYERNCKEKVFKNILLDGGFYNLGYLYRLQIARAALNSELVNEHAFIWDCNQFTCKNILNSLKIKNISNLKDSFTQENLLEAEIIYQEIKTKDGLINYVFPLGVPGIFIYDAILKGQKGPTVNFENKITKDYIFKYLSSIKFAENLINNFEPDIVLLSHAVSYQCAPLAWLAAKKRIPVLILYGQYGVPRLWRLKRPEDIFFGLGHPLKKDVKELNEKKIYPLRKTGAKYIKNRISGLYVSNDIGSKYAFQKKNKKKFDIPINKDKKMKTVAIYLGNWFDFPHQYGMSRFLDILDWINSTIKAASKNKNVLWLIKAHPMDKWYGGLTLKDILKEKLPSNIILLPNEYPGKSAIEISDALITCHGTSALEFASLGKPVMVPDKGWYHDFGFTKYPKSKEDYLLSLSKDWFNKINKKKIESKAKLFAGLYFGIPDWQKNAVLPDDAFRQSLRAKLPKHIKKNKKIIIKEINLIKKWVNSGTIDYHTFKMKNSNKYSLP